MMNMTNLHEDEDTSDPMPREVSDWLFDYLDADCSGIGPLSDDNEDEDDD